jgi:hypothetical protein
MRLPHFVKTWRLWMGPLAGGCVWYALLAAAVWWWLCGGWTPARVERTLADLPNGSTPAEVEAFLQARGILSYGGTSEGGKPWLVAEIEGANVDPFFKGEIQIYFDFGQDGRLLGHRLDVDVWSL